MNRFIQGNACPKKGRRTASEKRIPQRFTATVQVFVKKHLGHDLSSEQIVGIACKENISIVSHGRIYQHIW
jgi:IS30 family transposase